MGSRDSAKTVTQIIHAFRDQPTWRQADLARHCGIDVKPLRVHLRALKGAGMPLSQDAEPPHVMWSVPAGYYPGGALFEDDDVALMARLVARTAQSGER